MEKTEGNGDLVKGLHMYKAKYSIEIVVSHVFSSGLNVSVDAPIRKKSM